MQNIITASGLIFEIEWAGIASIDGALRFEIKNRNVAEVFSAFSNSLETGYLAHKFNNDIAHEWTEYTEFYGIQVLFNGNVVVTMRKK